MCAMRIGCDNLVAATCTETTAGVLTFGTPIAMPGVMKLSINPNASMETAFYDDGPGDTAATLGKVEVEIEKSVLTNFEKGFLLGHSLDIKGTLISGSSDVPAWVAIGFRTLKSNGNYRYVWLYKGKFTDPEENNETKGDSINFQNDTIKGNFVKLEKTFTVAGKVLKPWKIEIDADDAFADAATMANWFNAVVLPDTTAVAATALSVAVVAGSVVGSTKATITGTASGRYVTTISGTSVDNVYTNAIIPASIPTYVSAANILSTQGVAIGRYLQVYDVDLVTGRVTKFYEKLLAAGDIMV